MRGGKFRGSRNRDQHYRDHNLRKLVDDGIAGALRHSEER